MGAGQKGKEGASSEQSKYPSVPSLLGDFPLRFRCTTPKSPASASHRLGAPCPVRSPLCLSSHCALCEGATWPPHLLLPISL